MKIDGHQRPWAASRLEQGIAPPRRPRSGGVTAAPRVRSQRRCRPPGRAVIRTCRRCPCEAAPRCCVIVPRGDLRGIPSPPSAPFISHLLSGSLRLGDIAIHNFDIFRNICTQRGTHTTASSFNSRGKESFHALCEGSPLDNPCSFYHVSHPFFARVL